ncbi:hypothetical protein LXL04_001212 [Taraxacum kok-saghyz]
MSDQFHIQEEIMKRLPVKSLVQFRCVSKAWKSLIDSSDFIAAHSLRRHTQPHYLLLSICVYPLDVSRCYTDDDTFPQQTSVPTLPLSVKQLPCPFLVGSSQGLLCFLGSLLVFVSRTVVLWNPSIRKSIAVHVPDIGVGPFTFGFGVCPVTNDPKILAMIQLSEFMIYTLNTGKWRILSTNLPSKRTGGLFFSVITDRFIYWHVLLNDLNLILSFDLISESFELIDLPDSLARCGPSMVRFSKLRDSLAFLQHGDDYNSSIVWMMEVGARKSFTKLFTIATNHENIVGFSKNGIPMIRVVDNDDDDEDEDGDMAKLVVYEPNSENNIVLDVCDLPCCSDMISHMETLLLLGRSDYILEDQPSHLTISHLKAYEYSILPFKYFSNLKTTKSSKPPVPKNKLNLVNSLVAAAPHLHVPEGPVEAPTSSNSVVANPATDSAVDNTATDSSSVST